MPFDPAFYRAWKAAELPGLFRERTKSFLSRLYSREGIFWGQSIFVHEALYMLPFGFFKDVRFLVWGMAGVCEMWPHYKNRKLLIQLFTVCISIQRNAEVFWCGISQTQTWASVNNFLRYCPIAPDRIWSSDVSRVRQMAYLSTTNQYYMKLWYNGVKKLSDVGQEIYLGREIYQNPFKLKFLT